MIKITKGDDEIMNYTIEKITEDREWYKFTDINAKGEKLLIEVMKITCDLKNKKNNSKLSIRGQIYYEQIRTRKKEFTRFVLLGVLLCNGRARIKLFH